MGDMYISSQVSFAAVLEDSKAPVNLNEILVKVPSNEENDSMPINGQPVLSIMKASRQWNTEKQLVDKNQRKNGSESNLPACKEDSNSSHYEEKQALRAIRTMVINGDIENVDLPSQAENRPDLQSYKGLTTNNKLR